MQVDLPVELRVVVDRQRRARELAGEASAVGVLLLAALVLVEQVLVDAVGAGRDPVEARERLAGLRVRERIVPALLVGGGLRGQLLTRLRRLPPPEQVVHAAAAGPLAVDLFFPDRLEMGRVRHVELAVEPGVARGILVDAGGAVAEPLACDEDRRLDVQLELAHLEGRRVAMAQEVADQRAVLPHMPRACAVGDPRRLHDGGIVAHVVNHADEAVVEHVEALVEDGFPAPAPWRAWFSPRRRAGPRSPPACGRRSAWARDGLRWGRTAIRVAIIPRPASACRAAAAPSHAHSEHLYCRGRRETVDYGDKRCSK